MQPVLTEVSQQFLATHEMAVLSTISEDNNVHGAVIYYLYDSDKQAIYFVSRTETGKIRHIEKHSQVAFTVVEEQAMQTLQISCQAEKETDLRTKEKVINAIIKPRTYQGDALLPPVTAQKEGGYTVIKLTPISASYTDYKELIQNQA